MEIFKEFIIEAAHKLPNVPDGHQCGRLHGHSFHIKVHLRGSIDNSAGWVLDFGDIKKVFQPLYDQLDHHYLNEIDGLANPTSENLAIWIWQRLSPTLHGLSAVAISETCTSGCIYRGDPA